MDLLFTQRDPIKSFKISFLILITLFSGSNTFAQDDKPEINDSSSINIIALKKATEIRLNTTQKDSAKQKAFSPLPMIIFGFAGLFAGASVGRAIEDPPQIPGEFPELITTGTAIGAGIGLITGGTIGYFLGKNVPKEEKNKQRPEYDGIKQPHSVGSGR